ncbi:hypothetical protein [Mesorhizobium amorphae]|uniref:hypothetical protein n=1 Tax=Mesorhizobium amorphae TaxID=71433 RepID=UPI00177BCE8B|nr:hypothetical protein [Mesorhizobium amorphae]
MEADERLSQLLKRAIDNLSLEASEPTRQMLVKRLEKLATELALEWIVGERRFENVSQQTEYWLARLYEDIFIDEQPDATRIYSRLGFALPRSQYLARLLIARRSAHWRQAARKEVADALSQIEKKAREAIEKKQGATQRFELSLSKGRMTNYVSSTISWRVLLPANLGRCLQGGSRRPPSSFGSASRPTSSSPFSKRLKEMPNDAYQSSVHRWIAFDAR